MRYEEAYGGVSEIAKLSVQGQTTHLPKLGLRYDPPPSERLGILCPQLAGYQLKDVSSMVEAAEMATVHAAPGVFNPQTSRLVKIHLADSSRWANLGELRTCYKRQTKHMHFIDF